MFLRLPTRWVSKACMRCPHPEHMGRAVHHCFDESLAGRDAGAYAIAIDRIWRSACWIASRRGCSRACRGGGVPVRRLGCLFVAAAVRKVAGQLCSGSVGCLACTHWAGAAGGCSASGCGGWTVPLRPLVCGSMAGRRWLGCAVARCCCHCWRRRDASALLQAVGSCCS